MTSSAAKRKHNFILNVRYDIFVRSSTPIQLMNLLLESSMFTRLSKYFRGPKNLSHLLSRFIKRHWLIDVHHFKSALNFPFTSYNSVPNLHSIHSIILVRVTLTRNAISESSFLTLWFVVFLAGCLSKECWSSTGAF